MWTALLSKEMRECSLYAALALLVQMHYLGGGMDLPLIPLLSQGRGGEVPFTSSYNSDRESIFTAIAIILAIVLGLHQTIWESWRQTTLFLLHRPMPRSRIFIGKMLAAALLLLGVTAIPLLIYSLWAATPGTHASPFYWGMTEPWWRSVVVGFVCYLGAFLTGIRPARWLGSRTWPVIAVLVMSIGLKYAPVWTPLNYLGLALMTACLLMSILDTAERREFP